MTANSTMTELDFLQFMLMAVMRDCEHCPMYMREVECTVTVRDAKKSRSNTLYTRTWTNKPLTSDYAAYAEVKALLGPWIRDIKAGVVLRFNDDGPRAADFRTNNKAWRDTMKRFTGDAVEIEISTKAFHEAFGRRYTMTADLHVLAVNDSKDAVLLKLAHL